MTCPPRHCGTVDQHQFSRSPHPSQRHNHLDYTLNKLFEAALSLTAGLGPLPSLPFPSLPCPSSPPFPSFFTLSYSPSSSLFRPVFFFLSYFASLSSSLLLFFSSFSLLFFSFFKSLLVLSFFSSPVPSFSLFSVLSSTSSLSFSFSFFKLLPRPLLPVPLLIFLLFKSFSYFLLLLLYFPSFFSLSFSSSLLLLLTSFSFSLLHLVLLRFPFLVSNSSALLPPSPFLSSLVSFRSILPLSSFPLSPLLPPLPSPPLSLSLFLPLSPPLHTQRHPLPPNHQSNTHTQPDAHTFLSCRRFISSRKNKSIRTSAFVLPVALPWLLWNRATVRTDRSVLEGPSHPFRSFPMLMGVAITGLGILDRQPLLQTLKIFWNKLPGGLGCRPVGTKEADRRAAPGRVNAPAESTLLETWRTYQPLTHRHVRRSETIATSRNMLRSLRRVRGSITTANSRSSHRTSAKPSRRIIQSQGQLISASPHSNASHSTRRLDSALRRRS
ncbi:hypothetical protein C7M84_024102 [Penaeus vannamei]|uniref:Uncharacterized protein n=1 Tax=Penaeus vannamei TaxID=6689 RepID=A0A423U202_PENVA|nr:hypothetical protein C7M84_024102 [Penaeus vannamei]